MSVNIKYIPDEAINLVERDLLGTLAYVETIEGIIKKETIENDDRNTHLTIGLFGYWGSGKSSIIKTLQEKYEKDNSGKMKVFIYDAWKYSEDDFRRTFILELRKFFGLDTKEEEELFYKDKTEDVKYIPKIDGYSLLLLIIVFVLLMIAGYFYLKLNIIQNFLGSLSIGGLVSILFSLFRQVIVYHRIAITTTKLFAPEQFENRFKKTIEEIKKKNEIKKLVIAIDNIDRCHKEQVFEILLTIKNFLEIEDVVFIVPVDDRRLREYLQMKDEDANEFLRKIFNIFIRIRYFSETELYDFGIKLLEEYKIDLPKKEIVISMVCQEFSKNSRKIIHFLNTLQTEYYLAKIQEEKGYITKGKITENIQMLVKVLILREEYPKIFEEINDNKALLSEINDAIRKGEFSIYSTGDYYFSNRIRGVRLSKELYRFFLRTLNVELDVRDLEVFFLNRDMFKDVPDSIYQAVISQDWESLKKALNEKKVSLDELLNFIDKIVDEDVIRRELFDTSGFNLTSLIFKIFADPDYGSQITELPKNVHGMLEIPKIYKHIFKFPLKELIKAMRILYEKIEIKTCIEETIEQLNSLKIDNIKGNQNYLQFLKEFIETFKDKHKILSKIKGKFCELLKADFSLYFEFKEIIDSEYVRHLIDSEFVKNIIDTLNQDYKQNQTKEKIDLIKTLNKYKVINQDVINTYLRKVIQFIPSVSSPHGPPSWDVFIFWIEAISGFVKNINDTDIISNLYNALGIGYEPNAVYHRFSQRLLSEMDLRIYKTYISVLGELYLVANSSQKQGIVSQINKFLYYQIPKNIFLHLIDVYKNIIENTSIWLFADKIIDLMKKETNTELRLELIKVINLMMKKTKEGQGLNQKQVNMVISHYFESLEKGEENANDWIIEICENEFIANAVIEYIINLREPSRIQRSVIIISSLIDKYGFDNFYPKIRELLASSDVREQEVGILILYEIKDKVSQQKRTSIKNLLSEVNTENLSEELKIKLDELKKFFSN